MAMSILASLNIQNEYILLVGTHSTKTAFARIENCLNIEPTFTNKSNSGGYDTDPSVPTIIRNKIIIVEPSSQDVVDQIKARYSQFIATKQIEIVDRKFDLYHDLVCLGRSEVNNIVDRVFVNLENQQLLKLEIFKNSSKLRIPINTYQQPELSNFHMVPAYKNFETGLQIGITTNGNGCILGNRIKKELINKFVKTYKIDKVVKNCGELKTRVQVQELADNFESDMLALKNNYLKIGMLDFDEDQWDNSQLNNLVLERQSSQRHFKKYEKSRWLSQIIEYYPLEKLATITFDELNDSAGNLNKTDSSSNKTIISNDSNISNTSHQNNLEQVHDTIQENSSGEVNVDTAQFTQSLIKDKKGTLSLVGSGPGSLSMLTLGALHEIKTADLILADKLVPEQVLSIIPSSCELFIAKKFPGNAERAQEELMERALVGLQQSLKVVRLKQGDPYIFGRGGEEFEYFKQMGDYEIKVLPGLSSALSSTVLANIPATQRDVADQVLILTGTGRKGVLPEYPEYVPTRTTVFLMALHRAEVLQNELINNKKWDPTVPVAIVERASCVDQRVVRTKLKDLSEVVKIIGSRPPGLIIMGNSVDFLNGSLKEGQLYDIVEGFEDIDVSKFI